MNNLRQSVDHSDSLVLWKAETNRPVVTQHIHFPQYTFFFVSHFLS